MDSQEEPPACVLTRTEGSTWRTSKTCFLQTRKSNHLSFTGTSESNQAVYRTLEHRTNEVRCPSRESVLDSLGSGSVSAEIVVPPSSRSLFWLQRFRIAINYWPQCAAAAQRVLVRPRQSMGVAALSSDGPGRARYSPACRNANHCSLPAPLDSGRGSGFRDRRGHQDSRMKGASGPGRNRRTGSIVARRRWSAVPTFCQSGGQSFFWLIAFGPSDSSSPCTSSFPSTSF